MKLGILADPHEDILRLKEAINSLEKYNCDELICLGDIVGYRINSFDFFESRNAKECIGLIRDNCKHVVVGNHDLYAIRKTPEHTAGFTYPENWYRLDYDTRKEFAKEKIWLYEESELSALIGNKDIEYLASLPEYKIVSYDDINILLSHFIYPDLTGSTAFFPEKAKDLNNHFEFMREHDCMIGLSGHGHVDGYALAYEGKLRFQEYGPHTIKLKPQWINAPCISRGNHANGFMTLDTKSMMMEAIPFNK